MGESINSIGQISNNKLEHKGTHPFKITISCKKARNIS